MRTFVLFIPSVLYFSGHFSLSLVFFSRAIRCPSARDLSLNALLKGFTQRPAIWPCSTRIVDVGYVALMSSALNSLRAIPGLVNYLNRSGHNTGIRLVVGRATQPHVALLNLICTKFGPHEVVTAVDAAPPTHGARTKFIAIGQIEHRRCLEVHWSRPQRGGARWQICSSWDKLCWTIQMPSA